MQDDRPVVAHVSKRFFETTETFIYSYLSHLERFHPICLSSLPITNGANFPFPSPDIYVAGPKRPVLGLCIGGWRRLSGREAPEERVMRGRSVRLIHAHFGPTGWRSLTHKKHLGLPLVTTFYGYDLAPVIPWERGNWIERRQELFGEGDLFLVEGPFMRKTLIALGCPAEKVEIQRIALPLDKLPFSVRKPRPGSRVRILFTGRFTEKKGLIYALRAVGELGKERKDFELRIIGSGKLAGEFEKFIRKNRLDDCVKLLGLMNYREYLGEMAAASIFLHPSVVASNGDTEGGAPTVILEAQAMGMPVVSTFHADIPYVTVPGKSAILVPERDADGLKGALSHLLDRPEEWEEMGLAGRAHIEAHHNIVTEVSALEDKYQRLLSRDSSQNSSRRCSHI